MHPEFFKDFISQVSNLEGRGINAPSTLALSLDIHDTLSRKGFFHFSSGNQSDYCSDNFAFTEKSLKSLEKIKEKGYSSSRYV